MHVSKAGIEQVLKRFTLIQRCVYASMQARSSSRKQVPCMSELESPLFQAQSPLPSRAGPAVVEGLLCLLDLSRHMRCSGDGHPYRRPLHRHLHRPDVADTAADAPGPPHTRAGQLL